MCLAVPMEITAIHDKIADVEIGGVTRQVRLVRRPDWSCPRFTGHSGGCGLSCDELAGRAHLQP